MNEKSEILIELADALKTVAGILVKLSDFARAAINAADEIKEAIKAPSHEEVRAVLAEKSRDGFTAEVKDLLAKYGANKLSEIQPEQYAALLKDAKEIGNGSK